MLKKYAFFILLQMAAAALVSAAPKEYVLLSPDKTVELRVAVGAVVTYSIKYEGRMIVVPSAVSMTLEGGVVLGKDAQVRDEKRRSANEVLHPVVKQKSADIVDRYNELTLSFKGDYALIFRAYDDGVAYRFSTQFAEPITVVSEQAEFAFGQDHKLYFPEEESFQSHQERIFKYMSLSEISAKKFSSAPAVVEIPDGPKVAITEADLEDYAGLWLTGADDSPTKLVGKFPALALKEEVKNDRDVLVAERAPYLAKTERAPRLSPGAS